MKHEITQHDRLSEIKLNNFQPFTISVNGGILHCENLLRAMPNKRLVVQGRWNNHEVVAKLFFSKAATKYLCKEEQGIEAITGLEIHTAKLLYSGITNVAGVYAVVYQYLKPDLDNDQIWLADDANKLQRLVLDIQKIIGTLHNNGYCHQDLHPHNFLSHKGQLYTIDVADIRKVSSSKGLCVAKSLKNLCHYYAQLYLKHQQLIDNAFAEYCKTRGWSQTRKLQRKFQIALRKARLKRRAMIAKRAIRSCRTTTASSNFNRLCICQRELYDRLSLTDLDQLLDSGVILKAGNTCTVAKVMLNDTAYVLKRYNIKSWWHLLKISWRSSRALSCWKNAHILNIFGLKAPQPVAVIINKWGLLHGKAYFLMSYLKGDSLEQEQKQLTEQVIAILQQLQTIYMSQRDAKANNFLVDSNEIYLLDLESIKSHTLAPFAHQGYRKSLARFMAN